MRQAAIDELLKQCSSIYKLVVIAAKRAKELAEGSQKFVETDLKKVTSIALEEIRQGKVIYDDSQDKPKGERKSKGRVKDKQAAAGKPAMAQAGKKKHD